MKKLLIIFILLILLLNSVSAFEKIDASLEKLTAKIVPGGKAEYLLKITNNQVRDDIFQISPDDFSVHPFSDAAYSIIAQPAQIKAPSKKTIGVNLIITIQSDVKPDRNYVSYIWIKSIINQEVKLKIPITTWITAPKDLVLITPDFPPVLPNKKNFFTITFSNQANMALENLDLFITSSIFTLEDKISLFSLKEDTKDYTMEIDSAVKPGRYPINIRLFEGQNLRGEYSTELKVVESSELLETTSTDKGFLSSREVIVKTNEGNKDVQKEVKYPISWFRRMFTSVDPKPVILKEDKTYYYWSFYLKPKESYVIKINTDYKILFVALTLIGLAVLIFLYLKYKTVSIRKSIFKIKEEEGVSKLKVLLHIKNRTNKELHSLKVIDLLPNTIKLDEDFGTLKPEHIQKGSHGMRVIWEIPILESGEERVISYKIKSKLHIVGSMSLPSAVVQYHGKNRKLINIKSNRTFFLSK